MNNAAPAVAVESEVVPSKFEAKVAALRVACAALAAAGLGVEFPLMGGRISVGCGLRQQEVDLWGRFLDGASFDSFVSVQDGGKSIVIFSFTARIDGIEVAGQGSRPAHPDDFAGKVWSAGTFRRLNEEEALAEAARVAVQS